MKAVRLTVVLGAFAILAACASKPAEPQYVHEAPPVSVEPVYTGKYK